MQTHGTKKVELKRREQIRRKSSIETKQARKTREDDMVRGRRTKNKRQNKCVPQLVFAGSTKGLE